MGVGRLSSPCTMGMRSFTGLEECFLTMLFGF